MNFAVISFTDGQRLFSTFRAKRHFLHYFFFQRIIFPQIKTRALLFFWSSMLMLLLKNYFDESGHYQLLRWFKFSRFKIGFQQNLFGSIFLFYGENMIFCFEKSNSECRQFFHRKVLFWCISEVWSKSVQFECFIKFKFKFKTSDPTHVRHVWW